MRVAAITFALPLLVAAYLLSCVTTEETNRKALILVPPAQMHSLGAQSYKEILAKETLSKDKKLTQVVIDIGKRIAKASGKDFKWEFKLIDNDKTVNAFCLPGGKVAVYTGILPIAKTNAGLAAVLGHEVAHATLRHGAERVSQNMATQAGLAAASLSLKDSKYRNLILGGLGVGAQFGVLLPYSRSHESEADKVGLKYMAKAGYEPSEAPKIWERMAKKGSGGPEFMSTHPDPLRRAKDLRNEIPKVNSLFVASSKQDTINL